MASDVTRAIPEQRKIKQNKIKEEEEVLTFSLIRLVGQRQLACQLLPSCAWGTLVCQVASTDRLKSFAIRKNRDSVRRRRKGNYSRSKEKGEER